VPPPAPPPSTARDNWCNEITGEVTSAGMATTPRTFTMQLGIDTTNRPVNNDIIGFNFYIKEYTETYYRKIRQTDASWNPAFYYQFLFNLTNYSVATKFDMVIRIVYKDGTESSNQNKFQFDIGLNFSRTYPFNPFYGINMANYTSSTSILTTDQAPVGSVANPLDTVMPLKETLDGQFNNPKKFGTVPTIVFILDLPNAANRNTWYGQKVRYRRVMPGTDPAFEVKWDKTTTPNATYNNIDTLYVDNIVYDQKYEYVITPQVMSGGSIVDASQSWYGTGYIHNNRALADYPFYNWNKNFNWQLVQTSTALQTIDAAFPVPVATDAVIQISTFETRKLNNTNYGGAARDLGTYFELGFWHYITFATSHIANFSKLHIYRRDARLSPYAGVSANPFAGLGRWERIVWNSGTTLNLRDTTHGSEYNTYYQVSGFATTTFKVNNTGLMTNNKKVLINIAGTINQQYLFVVEFADTTLSTKGLLVTTQAMPYSSITFNQLSPNRPTTVNVSDFNPYTPGAERNLNEARTTASLNVAPLTANDVGFSGFVPASPSGTGTITKPLQYPTTHNGSAISPGII
jgi:hypothetical protein